jgi:integrase
MTRPVTAESEGIANKFMALALQCDSHEFQLARVWTPEFRELSRGALSGGARDFANVPTVARLQPAIGSSGERGSMARRRYQKGQLWKEDGNWHGRWREDVYGTNKRIRHHELIGIVKDFPTKRLAQRELDKRIEHVNRVTYRPQPKASFAEFAITWEREVLSQYRKSTSINYRTHIRKHLIPFFGGYAVRDLRPEMIQHFVSRSKASPKTTRNILITFQAMWTTAKAWGYVTHEVMEGVVFPTAKRHQRLFASQQQIQLIIAAAQEPYRTFYGLAAETGLRPGELCGLTVGDLDLERGILQVRQSAWRGQLGEPKTYNAIRVIELSLQARANLANFLHSWKPNSLGLLFATRHGTPWDQNMILKRRFKPLLKSLGIALPHGDGFYILRHGNATLMSSFGAPQKVRQQRLGHADGSPITETVYTHVVSEDGKRIAAQLGEAVWGILDPSWTGNKNGSGLEHPKPLILN